jgi:hypothetical protein
MAEAAILTPIHRPRAGGSSGPTVFLSFDGPLDGPNHVGEQKIPKISPQENSPLWFNWNYFLFFLNFAAL